MPKFNVKVRQTLRIERVAVVEIEADDEVDAINMIADGDYENPSDDSSWRTVASSVMHEDAGVLPQACPSNHWNDGTDICADCGKSLQ